MELLERHFDIALETPDGIKKLRKLILSLAMQGKLVPQDPNDQPASELLKEIDVEQRRLIAEGKIKKKEPLPPIKAEKIPYEVPKGWVWTRLGTIAEYIQRGRGPIYSEIRQIPIVSQKCIQWSGFNKHVVKFIEPSSINKYQCERFIRVGDLLWNSTGTGTIGRINIYQGELGEFDTVVADSHVTIVRLIGVYIQFVLNFLKSPSVQDDLEENASGTTNQIELNTTMVKNQLIPIPPLNEQKSIVAKIDQLMALCDKLEAERNDRDQKRLTIHKAAMNKLLSAPDKKKFNTSWGFITNNFGELYSVPQNVEELKKAILQLAVMGKLVPQDPNDQPASELLKEIEAEKKRLIKEENLKTGANSIIDSKEEYLGKPIGWEYCRLGNLAKFIDYRGRTPQKVASGISLITAKNVRYGFINREPYEYITEEDYDLWMTRGFPKKNDLLFTTEAPLGNIAIVDIEEKFALAQRVICFQLHNPGLAPFLRVLIMSASFQEQLLEQATGMTATGIKASKLKEVPVPIPPLAEQKRIVAKIDQLMQLCNTLEHQINNSTNKQTAIFNAVLAKV
jgi:type I restriction enzyme S subunit